jgi:hypothetical protein
MPKPKAKPICPHDKPQNWRGAIMFRCKCGNVWLGGRFHCSVPKDRSAVAVLGLTGGPVRGEA